jgi:hypothetical protein
VSAVDQQVPTRSVSTEWVMTRAAFRAGVEDVRAGRTPRFDYFAGLSFNEGWNYERGRFFAILAPISMPLKISGKVNPKAVCLYEAALRRGYVQP